MSAGGVETGTLDLALCLGKAGHSVTVVSSGGKLADLLEREGISHINLPIHRKSPLVLLLVPAVASLIRSREIEIVHASSRVPAWVGFLACKLTGTAFVTSCHGFYSGHFLSRVMGWGRLVMVISKSIEKRMREAFNVPMQKIRLVSRGVDLVKFPYDGNKYNRPKNTFTVINVGRITPIKGQDEFIKAMKRVMQRIDLVEVWIVGSPEKGKERYLTHLKDLTKNLGIENTVKFLGLRRDVKELLKKADCLVLSTSVPEGFGRVLIEAGALGCACVAPDAGGVKEIIEDGVSGLLFPPKDEKKMAEATVKMLGNMELCKRCAGNLRKNVEENFTLEKMTSLTLSVYKEALQK